MAQQTAHPGSKRGRRGKTNNKKKTLIQPKKVYRIYTEGTVTEPHYFESLELRQDIHAEVIGTGCNTDSLVQHAINDLAMHYYDEAWVVFDRDGFENNQITQAFSLADTNEIKCAFSNQAFEYWILLHYNLLTSDLHRKILSQNVTRLGRRITGNNQYTYEKSGHHPYFEILNLKPNIQTAINHARQQDLSLNIQNNFERLFRPPNTGVWKLVEQLI